MSQDIAKRIEILNAISKDIENDVSEFEGAPFNGRTVSVYMGRQAACIQAVANILRATLEESIDELS